MSQPRKKPRLERGNHRPSQAASSLAASVNTIRSSRKAIDSKLARDASKFIPMGMDIDQDNTTNDGKTQTTSRSAHLQQSNMTTIESSHPPGIQDLTPDEMYERKVAGIIYSGQDWDNNDDNDNADSSHQWTNKWESFYHNIDKVIKGWKTTI